MTLILNVQAQDTTRPVAFCGPDGSIIRNVLREIQSIAHIGLLAFEESSKAIYSADESSRETISSLQQQIEGLQLRLDQSQKQNVSLKIVNCKKG